MSQEIAFVTGANGFVGSHLVEFLIEKGLEVHCLLRSTSNDQYLKNLELTIHRGGIEDVDYLKEVFETYQPNYIFHIAGTVTARTYKEFERGNVLPAECILRAALNIPSIKKIMITSSLAASKPTTVGHPNTEDCIRAPLTDYGKSKVAEEDLAISYMDKLPITIVRPPIVYGERETEVLLFFKTVASGLIPLIGFNNKTLSMVYVKDLVRGMYQCVISENSQSETYFIGGFRDEYSWLEIGKQAAKALKKGTITVRVPHVLVYSIAYLFEWVAKIFGKAASLNSQKASEMVCESWSCSSQKASKDFNYRAQVDIDEGFEKTINWYKERSWL